MELFKLLFSFKGRIGRLSYAFVFLGSILIEILATIATAAIMGLPVPHTPPEYVATTEAVRGLIWPLNLVITWTGFASGAKRLHDLGRSGWLQGGILLALSVAFFVLGFGASQQSMAVMAVGGLLSLVVGLYSAWIGIQMLFFAGEAGSNDYGPPPGTSSDGSRLRVARDTRFVPASGPQRFCAPAQAGFGRRR